VLDEMTLEDRINEEVRKILEQYGDQMKQFGATYEEAFKVIKKQLVHDRKVVI
jgi:hypothetical protein